MSMTDKAPPIRHIDRSMGLTDDLLKRAALMFGTPLYVYDGDLFPILWSRLRGALPAQNRLYYSVKANPNLHIIREFTKLGAHFEVASGGELAAVTRVGVPPDHVIFVGPGKTDEELDLAVSSNINAVVVESLQELDRIARIAHRNRLRQRVAIRINPGIGGGTLSMGGATQFGMAPSVALQILNKPISGVEIIGIHAYLGTGILKWEELITNTAEILRLADNIQQTTGQTLLFVDVGGGFGIPYYERDQPLDLQSLWGALEALVGEYLSKYPNTETIAFESGRFLVGPSVIFLTRVLDLKVLDNKYFVILDGGINNFVGYDHYFGARPTPVRVLDQGMRDLKGVSLCGPLCTTADRLATDVLLPLPEIGDLVAFFEAGAYGLSASPGLFLSRGYPSEVLRKGNDLHLIRSRS